LVGKDDNNKFGYHWPEKEALLVLANVLRRPIVVVTRTDARHVKNNVDTARYVVVPVRTGRAEDAPRSVAPLVLRYSGDHYRPIVTRKWMIAFAKLEPFYQRTSQLYRDEALAPFVEHNWCARPKLRDEALIVRDDGAPVVPDLVDRIVRNALCTELRHGEQLSAECVQGLVSLLPGGAERVTVIADGGSVDGGAADWCVVRAVHGWVLVSAAGGCWRCPRVSVAEARDLCTRLWPNGKLVDRSSEWPMPALAADHPIWLVCVLWHVLAEVDLPSQFYSVGACTRRSLARALALNQPFTAERAPSLDWFKPANARGVAGDENKAVYKY